MRKGQYSYETHQALALIDSGVIPAEAARQTGIHPSSIYRVLGQIRRQQAAENKPKRIVTG